MHALPDSYTNTGNFVIACSQSTKYFQGIFGSQLCFRAIVAGCSLNKGIDSGVCCGTNRSVSRTEDMKKVERGKKKNSV